MDYRVFVWINGLAGHHLFLDSLMQGIATYGPLLFVIPLLSLWFTGQGAGRRQKRRACLRAFLTALAMLLMFSRVYVGLHYPFDVLGGMVIGILAGRVVETAHFLNAPIDMALDRWERRAALCVSWWLRMSLAWRGPSTAG